MGYDLYREGESTNDYFRWNIWGFPPIFALGELYGWEPMGCKYQEEGEVGEIGYFSNDGQTVIAEDAQNWANALKLALKELKPSNVHNLKEFNDEFWIQRTAIRNGEKSAIIEWFGDKDSIEYIGQYITFLEGGSFNIC